MTQTAIVDRLAAHTTLAGAPQSELAWLADHGALHHFAVGDIIETSTRETTRMYLLLTGRVAQFLKSEPGSRSRRKFMEWRAGEVTGLLPFSRMGAPPGDSVIEEATDALIISRDHFSELLRECPIVTTALVHVMLDRARDFTSGRFQDEKMISLGRLAAGLAHELNNPASAVARSAKLLIGALGETKSAARALIGAQVTAAEFSRVEGVLEGSLMPTATGVFSAIERADHEDTVVGWLEVHGASLAPAAALSESGVTTDALDELADSFSGAALDATLRWMAADYMTRTLAADVERATTRIYDLVSSIKRFTYMNRTASVEPTNVAQGLSDTVTMVAAKARARSVAVRMDVPANLPMVPGNAGELNQVWLNLLENALDAVAEGGGAEVIVRAARVGDDVVISVIDNGPGIPADVAGRIFDPFFTTKPIGQGTGLGLDISRRIVELHGGQISAESRPGGGRTEFRVALPIERGKSE